MWHPLVSLLYSQNMTSTSYSTYIVYNNISGVVTTSHCSSCIMSNNEGLATFWNSNGCYEHKKFGAPLEHALRLTEC